MKRLVGPFALLLGLVNLGLYFAGGTGWNLAGGVMCVLVAALELVLPEEEA